MLVRDWSLIMGRGAAIREGGVCEVLPLRKGGQKSFSHAEGGGTTSFGVVFM